MTVVRQGRLMNADWAWIVFVHSSVVRDVWLLAETLKITLWMFFSLSNPFIVCLLLIAKSEQFFLLVYNLPALYIFFYYIYHT